MKEVDYHLVGGVAVASPECDAGGLVEQPHRNKLPVPAQIVRLDAISKVVGFPAFIPAFDPAALIFTQQIFSLLGPNV